MTVTASKKAWGSAPAKRSSFLTYDEWCQKVRGTARDTPANHALVREVVRALDDLEATMNAAVVSFADRL